jgi:hypothetical protein
MYELRFIMHNHLVSEAHQTKETLEQLLRRHLSGAISIDDLVSAIYSGTASSDGEEGDDEREELAQVSDHVATSESEEDGWSDREEEGQTSSEVTSEDIHVRDSRVEVEVMAAIPEVNEVDAQAATSQAHINSTIEIALSQEHHHQLAAQTQQEIQHDIEEVQSLSRVSEIVNQLSQAPIPAPRQRPLRRQMPPPVAPRPRRSRPAQKINSLQELSTQQLVAQRLSSPHFLAQLSSVLDGDNEQDPAHVIQRIRRQRPRPVPRAQPRRSPPRTYEQTQQPSAAPSQNTEGEDYVRPPDRPYVSRLMQPSFTAPANPGQQIADQVEADITELLTRRLVQNMLNGEYRTVLEVHLQQRAEGDGTQASHASAAPRARGQRSPSSRGQSVMSQLRQRLMGRANAPRPPPAPAADAVHRSSEDHAQLRHAAPVAGSNFRTMHTLQEQVNTLSQQMSDMMSMVRTTYQVQLDLMRAVRQEVSAGLQNDAESAPYRPPPPRPAQPAQGNNCSICMDVAADTVMYRCGHLCACYTCAQQLRDLNQNCPCCRAPVVDILRVYWS